MNAFRPDLADMRLKGQVSAAHFVEGRKAKIIVPAATVHGSPDSSSATLTQAFYGEAIYVFEDKEGWAWVQLARDGYVGYVSHDSFHYGDWQAMTHRIDATATHLYPAPDMKQQPLRWLPFGAQLAVKDYSEDRRWAEVYGGWVFTAHIGPITEIMPDYVDDAMRFIGAPYLWGGKTGQGIDCSGLVQVVLQAAGYDCPRDSDMQWAGMGQVVEKPQRGDLAFWHGHVGIMLDEERILHANATTMNVAIEMLADVIGRSVFLGFKRLR